MDLYVVEFFGYSYWSSGTDSGVDIIFDSLEKATNYVEEKSKEIMTSKENFDRCYYDHMYYLITKMKCNEPVLKEGTDVWTYNVREQRWANPFVEEE